ncbi:MAG: SRPBCC family protein [Leptolyngbyaceae cyanobacterium bins.59]|nr:SRPBCC family protein [Leptolyngbyaceae cyanobacterium bins.59]
MASYHFLSVWVLDAPLEKVWQAIVDYDRLPVWWKAVAEVRQLQAGDDSGVGTIWYMKWKTPLSYTLAFELRTTQVDAPTLLELTAVGEVEGTGRWELVAAPEGTLVKYFWNVRTTKAWMNLLAAFVRPLLQWNHNAVMRQGAEGLAQFLGARLLKAEAVDPSLP